jgi:flagellar basal body-associated protein FliL
MKKSYLMIAILVLVLLILSGVGYWYWQSQKTETKTVPSVSTNPLDNKPDINPVDQTNPFKNIKTNPFE